MEILKKKKKSQIHHKNYFNIYVTKKDFYVKLQ